MGKNVRVGLKWLLVFGLLWLVFAAMLLALKTLVGFLRLGLGRQEDVVQTMLTDMGKLMVQAADHAAVLLVLAGAVCLGGWLWCAMRDVRHGTPSVAYILSLGSLLILGAFFGAAVVLLLPIVDVPSCMVW